MTYVTSHLNANIFTSVIMLPNICLTAIVGIMIVFQLSARTHTTVDDHAEDSHTKTHKCSLSVRLLKLNLCLLRPSASLSVNMCVVSLCLHVCLPICLSICQSGCVCVSDKLLQSHKTPRSKGR